MENSPPLALLIAGIDAVGTGRLPRILADAGFKVHLLGSRRLAAARSTFVARTLPCPRGPVETAAVAREFPSSEGANRYAFIVIADEPTMMAALALPDRTWLEGWFPVPLSADFGRLVTHYVPGWLKQPLKNLLGAIAVRTPQGFRAWWGVS